MKILSASVRVIDDKSHVRTLGLSDVEITIKGDSPIQDIPEIKEQEIPKKKPAKPKKTKKSKN